MEIQSTRIMRGPNYWSDEIHNLIIVRLHDKISEPSKNSLEELKDQAMEVLPIVPKNIGSQRLIPSLFGEITLALQRQIGEDVQFFTITPTLDQDIFNVAIEYNNEEIGLEACAIAAEILNDLSQKKEITMELLLDDLIYIKEREDTIGKRLFKEIKKLKIPVRESKRNTWIIGFGKHQLNLVLDENGEIKLTKPGDISFKNYISTEDLLNKEAGNLLNNQSLRIPLVAITGTNGKTTTARLTAHIALTSGMKTGLTTTEGIYVNGEEVEKGDCTGPKSTEVVLNDPTIDYAVLECARGGILRSGLAFDRTDISIITNLGEDHLQLKDINTMEEMTRVKEVVARAVSETGYAILNATDDRSYNMRENVKGEIALFSLDPDNERLRRHMAEGDLVATLEDEYIILKKAGETIRIEHVGSIPITYEGKASFNIENALAATLAGYLSGFSLENISEGLRTFFPSPEQIPGRMNMFHLKNADIMIDYAHNAHGMSALSSYLNKVNKHKIGVISSAGDRRNEDIINFGRISGKVFTEIVIRHDIDMRGRDKNELTELLSKGVRESGSVPISVISDETEAIKQTYKTAKPGSLITICSEKVDQAIQTVRELQADELSVNEQNHPESSLTQ